MGSCVLCVVCICAACGCVCVCVRVCLFVFEFYVLVCVGVLVTCVAVPKDVFGFVSAGCCASCVSVYACVCFVVGSAFMSVFVVWVS